MLGKNFVEVFLVGFCCCYCSWGLVCWQVCGSGGRFFKRIVFGNSSLTVQNDASIHSFSQSLIFGGFSQGVACFTSLLRAGIVARFSSAVFRRCIPAALQSIRPWGSAVRAAPLRPPFPAARCQQQPRPPAAGQREWL